MNELKMPQTLRKKYFKDYMTIMTVNICQVFKSINWKDKKANNQDVVMMVMLYFVHDNIQDNAGDRHAKDWIIDLADFPTLFNEFPWDVLAWEETYKSSDSAIVRRKKVCVENAKGNRKRVPYQLIGFGHVFQSWILELWNMTHAYFSRREGNPLPLPRLLERNLL